MLFNISPEKNEFLQKWFEISYLMSCIGNIHKNQPDLFGTTNELNEEHINELIHYSTKLYLSNIFSYHIMNDRMMMVLYKDDPVYQGHQIKFTEKWQPIKARMELLGFTAYESETNTIYSYMLWFRKEELRTIVQEISKEIKDGAEIFESIRWEQWLNFTYPLEDYPIRKKGTRLNSLFLFLEKISDIKTSIISLKKWEWLKKYIQSEDLRILEYNTISKSSSNFDVPGLFFLYSDYIFIPYIFLNRFVKSKKKIYFNPNSGKFLNLYGKIVELKIKKWITTINVDFRDKNSKILFRYKNKEIHPTEELFDLGYIHHPTQSFSLLKLKLPFDLISTKI